MNVATTKVPRRGAPWRGRLPSSAWKFTAFAAVCLVLLVGLAVKVGNLSFFQARHVVYAQLPDVTGLNSGDSVKIAGVTVGRVGSIALQRGHALIALDLDNEVLLRRGTEVGLHWRNVLGQKDVYLYPASTGSLIRAGGTIPIADSVSEASVNALLNSLGPVLDAINPTEANAFVRSVAGTLDSQGAEIDQLINSGAVVSQTIGSLDQEEGTVIDSLDQVLTAFAAHRSDLASVITNLENVASALASRNSLLDGVVTNLGQVAGEFASLVGTNRNALDGAIQGLDTVAQTIAANRQSLEKGLATLGAGLAPYTLISAYGQWFQIQTVYNCLAGEAACSYYMPSEPPAGTGPGGTPPTGRAPGVSSQQAPQSVAPTVTGMLQAVSGARGS